MGWLQTRFMRLPHSIAQPLSTRVLFAMIVALYATVFSFGAQTNTPQLTFSPSVLYFGMVPLGQTQSQLITLTNSGQTSVTVSAMSLLRGAEFSLPQLSVPLTLAAGQSIDLNVTFAPTVTGWVGGNAAFSNSASNRPVRFQFAGTGVISDAMVASPSSISFGQVTVGTSSTKTVVVTNNRSWKESISGFQTTGGEFSVSGPATPFTLAAGQSATLSITFAPQSASLAGGSVFVTGGHLNVPFTGTGTAPASAQLTVAPSSVNFGNVPVGTTATQSMTMSASGAAVTVSSDSSSNAQFALTGASFPLTIAAGQSLSINVAFAPKSSGAASGSLSFSSNASNSPAPASLAGTGTVAASPQLAVTPALLNFGDVAVGTTATQPITMSASGAAVTVSSDSSSNSQFVLNGAGFPLTIAAGQSVSFNVAFTPKSSGTESGSLSFASNATNSPAPESLAGIGTVTSYSVSLYWNASTNVAGYNVYRSTAANGTYAKVNPSLDAATAYTDSTVASGQTYYYEATSVNSSGQESSPSTPPVVAAVP
jgi:hypothetical protein